METITDMQIKDLMYFNDLLDANDEAYERGFLH